MTPAASSYLEGVAVGAAACFAFFLAACAAEVSTRIPGLPGDMAMWISAAFLTGVGISLAVISAVNFRAAWKALKGAG